MLGPLGVWWFSSRPSEAKEDRGDVLLYVDEVRRRHREGIGEKQTHLESRESLAMEKSAGPAGYSRCRFSIVTKREFEADFPQ